MQEVIELALGTEADGCVLENHTLIQSLPRAIQPTQQIVVGYDPARTALSFRVVVEEQRDVEVAVGQVVVGFGCVSGCF